MRLAAALPIVAVAGPLWLAAPAPAQAPPPALALPIQCRVGVDCEVQNYVDRDPGPGARDFTCGGRSYQDHNGVDFRLPTLTPGVAVQAAAAGKVTGVRDGVADVSVRTAGPASVAGRECGNGVIIGHDGGWQTQYCHMARGSVTVKAGDLVTAGQVIGHVGLSGQTEYPHLHFTVRQDGTVVDPFAHGAAPGACDGGRSLWTPAARAQLAYKARAVLNTGFAAQALTMELIDGGAIRAPAADSPAILAYARGIGLKAGDIQVLTLRGPTGAVLATNRAQPLPRDQAQNLIFTGARRPDGGWPRGRYTADYVVEQGGRPVLSRSFALGL